MPKDSDEFDDDLEDFMEVDDDLEFDTDFGEDLDEPDEEHDDVMLSDDDEPEEQATAEEAAEAPEPIAAEDAKPQEPAVPPPPMPAEELQPINLEETPVHVVVEVARLPMSVSQLVQLESGNVLDLKVKPENGVDLVVNNRLVGRGELVKVGDVIGVRVLETAK